MPARIHRLSFGQVHPPWIKKGCVLNNQGKLKQRLGRGNREYLRRSCAEAHSVVVAKCRIVTERRPFQSFWRVFAKIEPVHANTDFGLSGYLSNFVSLNTRVRGILPRINPMKTYLAAVLTQIADLLFDLRQIVFCRPPAWSGPRIAGAGIVHERNEVERGAQTAVGLHVPIKFKPEVIGQSQVHEWKREDSFPVLQALRPGQRALQHADERTEQGPI